jgi:hypothetical protein
MERNKSFVVSARSDPTTELMGPKKGKMMARNQMGTAAGSIAAARLQRLRQSWSR